MLSFLQLDRGGTRPSLIQNLIEKDRNRRNRRHRRKRRRSTSTDNSDSSSSSSSMDNEASRGSRPRNSPHEKPEKVGSKVQIFFLYLKIS